jgi:catechol 2,3-dioxygenase-like lactoylglutathione lyase family enzyme
MAGGHPLPLRQLAYAVADVDEAARAHGAAFGSGPFFVARHVPLAWSRHRGVDQPFDHSSAYGQWGEVMVELVCQHNHAPSALHDLYPAGSGRTGLHHAALWVDDLGAAIARFAAQGMALAQHSCTEGGTEFAFIDATARLGHMLELYEPSDTLTGFYAMVARAARGWDGSDPVRELG